MTNFIKEELEVFREEYRKAYKGIFSDEVLEKSNPWFEEFLRSSHLRLLERVEKGLMKKFDDMELNGVKFTENDNWRNYKFVRNNIRDFINELKSIE